MFRACIWNALTSIVIALAFGCTPPAPSQPKEPDAATVARGQTSQETQEPQWDVIGRPPDNSQLHEIDENDLAYKIMAQYEDMVMQRHTPIGIECKEVKGPAAKRLFPEYRFFVCEWHDASAYFVDAIAMGKLFSFTSIGYGLRYDKSFGEFLAEHKVKITDEKSAHLVWDAYCEILRHPQKTNKIEKVSDRHWRLGILDTRPEEPGRAYYDVHLNKDLTVESAEWTIEPHTGQRGVKR